MFAKEYSPERYDYWIITKPEVLEGFDKTKGIAHKTTKALNNYKNIKIFTEDDEITNESVVKFVKIDEQTALYYRDLWAHRLGTVKSESYYLVTLDDKAFSVVGFHSSAMLRLETDKVFEVFGFTAPHSKYPNLNRLLMFLITCEAVRPVLASSISRINRVYTFNGLKTTCLAKYRDVKLNKGILKRLSREKMPNGMYKIQYETDFHKRSFADCIKLYLEELDERKRKDAEKAKKV